MANSMSEEKLQLYAFHDKMANLTRFKQNLQEIMSNNFAIVEQHFIRKYWKLTELLIIEFLVQA